MVSRRDLKTMAVAKLASVRALLESGHYDDAYYLSGYVLEIALKARICKIIDADYPENGEISKAFKTHKFDTLVKLAGLERRLDRQKNSGGPAFSTNWSILGLWNETDRYTCGQRNKQDVLDILDALEHPKDGIFTWIKKTW